MIDITKYTTYYDPATIDGDITITRHTPVTSQSNDNTQKILIRRTFFQHMFNQASRTIHMDVDDDNRPNTIDRDIFNELFEQPQLYSIALTSAYTYSSKIFKFYDKVATLNGPNLSSDKLLIYHNEELDVYLEIEYHDRTAF